VADEGFFVTLHDGEYASHRCRIFGARISSFRQKCKAIVAADATQPAAWRGVVTQC
jgi:hypothetical protein